MSRQALEQELRAWDGRHTPALKDTYKAYATEDDFAADLIDLCLADVALQTASTWLLKHHLEHGGTIPTEKLNAYIRHADNLEGWEPPLHLLQSLTFVELTEEDIPYIDALVQKAKHSDVRILRAWAYHGLFEMSKVLPELREEVRLTCEQLLEKEEAPAVKARARNILKALRKLK